MKKLITLALLLLSAAAFARTKAEVQKDLAEQNKKYWMFPYSREYRKFEPEIMMKDAAYQAAKKAEADADAARTAWVDAELVKTPEGKQLVDAVAAADKKVAENDSDREAIAEQRAAKRAKEDFARKNGVMDWKVPEFRKLEMAWRAANSARIMAGVEAMLKSDNDEAKKAAQEYKDAIASIAKLREELKTADAE